MLDAKNFTGNLNIIDFKISSISEPVLSPDFRQVTLTFTGIADPENTSVDLTDYEYSLDEGTTWDTMTTASAVTGLTFSPAGTDSDLIWDIKDDIGNSIYNITIKIRLRAQATFELATIQTDYKVRSIYLSKATVTTQIRTEPILPPDYSGTSGTDMLKMAPKP